VNVQLPDEQAGDEGDRDRAQRFEEPETGERKPDRQREEQRQFGIVAQNIDQGLQGLHGSLLRSAASEAADRARGDGSGC